MQHIKNAEIITMSTGTFEDLVAIYPDRFDDTRGWFQELYQASRLKGYNISDVFTQDNISFSKEKHTLRGLHFQNPNGQAKLVTVLQGEILDVAVDIRINSLSRGKWMSIVLSAENRTQLYIPAGYAHGFITLTDDVLLHYKCSEMYTPNSEHSIAWNDPALNIQWPTDSPILSEADSDAPLLSQIDHEILPKLPGSNL